MIADALASSQFSSQSGTGTGTATVPAGCVLTRWWALSSSGDPCTVVLTPRGANQTNTAQGPFTLPAGGVAYGESYDGEMGAGTTIAFTDAASWRATYAKL